MLGAHAESGSDICLHFWSTNMSDASDASSPAAANEPNQSGHPH
jgi:hypothetical protein